MEKENAYDILIKNLTKRGLECETQYNERNFLVPGSQRMMNTKYVIAELGSCFFYAHDSFGSGSTSSSTYTGIYASVYLKPEEACYIYKKDWTDLIFRFKKRKTGVGYIDKNLTVTSSSGWTPVHLISHKEVELFLEINKTISPLKIIIQHNYFLTFDQLKNKTVIGIESDSWLYENKDLDTMINLGGQLINNMRLAVK